MITMQDIERLTHSYANAHACLCDVVGRVQRELELVRQAHMPEIHAAVHASVRCLDELHDAISNAPSLFPDKKKTRTFSGVRVGYTKRRGKVEISNEDKTIALIEATVPSAQAELLVRVKKSVDKTAVADLTAADLKRLGIRITDDDDDVVVKVIGEDLDKIVAALLTSATHDDRMETAA